MPRPEYHPAVRQGARDLAGLILPAFQKESIDAHVEQLLLEHEEVNLALQAYPAERVTLDRIARHTYTKHHKYIAVAKVVDTTDRILAVVTGLGEYVPAIGTVVRWGENTLELVPKAIYALWYAHGTGDHSSVLYFAGMEALSFTPFAGTAIDMMNIYLNRARLHYRDTVAHGFLASFEENMKKRAAAGTARDVMDGHVIDAEIIEPQRRLPDVETAQPHRPMTDVERAISSIKLLPAPGDAAK